MRILHSNSAAENLFDTGHLLKNTNGLLSASGQQETLDLRNLLTRVFKDRESLRNLSAFSLECMKTGDYFEFFALLLDENGPDLFAEPATMALVFVADPEQRVSIPFKLLNSLFGLTLSEARMAIALLNGASVEQFAEAAHISMNTARTHLKAIFQKTYTSSQSSLVSLLSRLVPPVDVLDEED